MSGRKKELKMPIQRTEAQREAARKNGKKSEGPVTLDGKARSSRNALTHGALAVVHRPADEPMGLVERIEQSLVQKYEPGTEGERALVRGLAGDLVRMDRLTKAEDAGVRLAKLEVGRRPEDNQALLRLVECREHWRLLKKSTESARLGLPHFDGGRGLAAATSITKNAEIAEQLLKFQGEPDTSIPGGRLMLDRKIELQRAGTPIDIANALLALIDAALSYLDAFEKKLVGNEQQRQTCELSIAELPDDALVRRIDRYRRAVEGSMLRRLQILRAMRDLTGGAKVVVE